MRKFIIIISNIFRIFVRTKINYLIAELLNNLKEKYGRNIFRQGYIYKLVGDGKIANVDMLSEDEKNGIS